MSSGHYLFSSSAVCFDEGSARIQGQLTVSFIIPVFNDQANIKRCIQSIQALHTPGNEYEIIVLDNGSTDGTHRVMEELGVPFEIVEQGHVSVLRNRGAQKAQGQFLAFIDSDVELCNELGIFTSVGVKVGRPFLSHGFRP